MSGYQHLGELALELREFLRPCGSFVWQLILMLLLLLVGLGVLTGISFARYEFFELDLREHIKTGITDAEVYHQLDARGIRYVRGVRPSPAYGPERESGADSTTESPNKILAFPTTWVWFVGQSRDLWIVSDDNGVVEEVVFETPPIVWP